MSHELRSPLNAILGFAQLMESAAPSPTDIQKESIAQILQAGWHLLNLINEILDLAVIESGKVALSTEPVSLIEVMAECQAMMEPEARRMGIRMEFPALEGPSYLRADRTRLKQVIINLLSNAIKYNTPRGSVKVECLYAAELTRISVKDTGAGLSSHELTQLFQPFNRLGQAARGSVAGTGIGLVVTKRLVELMGGAIGVLSTVGQGSVFWFELPTSSAPECAPGTDEPEAWEPIETPADGAPYTLLYVEDNLPNMKLVEGIVARRGDIRLLTAANGRLGIELARSAQPAVILMDINLPDISGIEALRVLRADPSTSRIPIIALSANAMPRDIEKGLEVGFFRYLTKPIRIGDFMAALNTALQLAQRPKATASNLPASNLATSNLTALDGRPSEK
jgi:CheY-like chemotaxis protein